VMRRLPAPFYFGDFPAKSINIQSALIAPWCGSANGSRRSTAQASSVDILARSRRPRIARDRVVRVALSASEPTRSLSRLTSIVSWLTLRSISASAAICLRLSIPSSGNCASSVLESSLPTPGTERSNSSRSRHRGVLRTNSPSSSSKPESRFSNRRMGSSILRCQNLWGSGPAILLSRQHLDQLAPPGNQRCERLALFVG